MAQWEAAASRPKPKARETARVEQRADRQPAMRPASQGEPVSRAFSVGRRYPNGHKRRPAAQVIGPTSRRIEIAVTTAAWRLFSPCSPPVERVIEQGAVAIHVKTTKEF